MCAGYRGIVGPLPKGESLGGGDVAAEQAKAVEVDGGSVRAVPAEKPLGQHEQAPAGRVVVVLLGGCPFGPGGMRRPLPHEPADVPEALRQPARQGSRVGAVARRSRSSYARQQVSMASVRRVNAPCPR